MHPRIQSHRDSRAMSPTASLGVPIGRPGFAGTAARTAHSPSADARPEASDVLVETAATTESTPADDGLIAEGPAGGIAPGSDQRDVEGSVGGDDITDVIPAPDGAAPADAATWGQDAS